jgi:dTDP-4-amino-4,6-dideoxygalactose transaminase
MSGSELDYIADAIRTGHAAGDGAYTRRCQALIEGLLGVPRAMLTTSCTHALEMAAILLDIQPGDEVIVPSFTFVSTANAFALRGARIVFADIRSDTLNLDEASLESLISERTRAIVVVHYAGIACDMDAIMAVADRHGIKVVEDNAHGFLGRYRGRSLGSFGCLATLSFHETKNFTCGEGGALLINDPHLIERAEIIREKGTDRSRFFRGQVDKYTWVDIGSSYLPSDILAAYLLAQLEQRDEIQARRRRVWETYDAKLTTWADAEDVRRPCVPADCEQSYHMYYLLLPSLATRTDFIVHMRSRGILSVFHYVPLHDSEMGERSRAGPVTCDVTQWISDRLVRLPFFNDLSARDQAEVIDAVTQFRVSGPVSVGHTNHHA